MRKFTKKISIFVFVFLSLFICVESLIPGTRSGLQSGFIASIISGGNKDTEVLPESISIKKEKTIMNVKENMTLKIDFFPSNTSDIRVKIESNNDEIIKIKDKTITALKEGKVDITVTSIKDSSISDSISLTINAVIPESLNASVNVEEISVGTTAKLDVSYQPSNVTYKSFEYQSTDSEVAVIDEFGIIRGINPGICEVYAKDLNYEGLESNRVTIIVDDKEIVPVSEITMSDISEIYLNQHVGLIPIFNDNASDKSFHIVSNNTNIIGVDNNFIVGKNYGVATIEIISNSNTEIKKVLEIEVKEIRARKIVVYEDYYTYGTPHKLQYKILSVVEGLEPTNKEVLYYSSDETIATIDENGNLYGLKQGKVTITVVLKSDESIKGSATITFNESSNTAWEKFKGLVRKLIGHFSLFLITGFFGYIVFREKIKREYALLINVGYGVLLAIISELLQLIPADRACQISDMLLDSLGYIIGMFIVIMLICIYKFIKRKKENN